MSGAVQYCTFYLEDLLFGLEVSAVQEVLRYQEITPVPLAPLVIRGLINLRGQIVTAIDLRRRLGLAMRPEGARPMNVVLRAHGEMVSFLVDRIGDVILVQQEDFEPLPDSVQSIPRDVVRGAYKLAKELMLVVDVERAARP